MSDCQKIRFQSRAEAKAYARTAHVKGTLHGNLHPYLCVRCDAWHLSSTAPRMYRRRKARG